MHRLLVQEYEEITEKLTIFTVGVGALTRYPLLLRSGPTRSFRLLSSLLFNEMRVDRLMKKVIVGADTWLPVGNVLILITVNLLRVASQFPSNSALPSIQQPCGLRWVLSEHERPFVFMEMNEICKFWHCLFCTFRCNFCNAKIGELNIQTDTSFFHI